MDDANSKQPVPTTSIRYVGIGELTVYLVSDDELRMIESGGPSSTYLNLAIFFLSVGASFGASLLLSAPASIHRFIVVAALTIGSLIAGSILLALWFRSRLDASNVISRIRGRAIVPPAGTIIDTRATED
jgi:hypothetical protein